jgi:hypothetical protein
VLREELQMVLREVFLGNGVLARLNYLLRCTRTRVENIQEHGLPIIHFINGRYKIGEQSLESLHLRQENAIFQQLL